MHSITAPIDPLIISLLGTVNLSTAVAAAIKSGDLEPEGAFARFSGTCHAVAPGFFDSKRFEAHEAFWCFDQNAPTNNIVGEVAWFQTGVYVSSPSVMPVPLLVHAGATTLEQLGTSVIDIVRVQVPLALHAVSEEAIQQLLDQFAAMAEIAPPVTVRARLITQTRADGWTTTARAWFDKTHLGPFALQDLTVPRDRVNLDNRWCFQKSKNIYASTFSSPEWSPAAASTITLLMLEAALATGIKDSVIVEVARIREG